jgi:DNA/RNA-binding domain of Phe-tRNA-synthetase-like protein
MTAPVTLDIAELGATFPAYRVALIVARGLRIESMPVPAIDQYMAESERQAAIGLVGRELAELPELAVWREAYKAFGVKKTSYRSSVERLLKAIQRGTGLPRVSTLVDIYNAISARYRLPIGADDLDRLSPPLAFRYSRPGDSFVALGDATAAPDPPKPGEVVYADAEKCLCRRWNWYQDGRSACSTSTTSAVLTVQSLGPVHGGTLEDAARELCRRITSVCGGSAQFGVADRVRPSVSVT